MTEIFPNYYPQFRCIAGDCGHSCCIGWEIDIDEASAEAYRLASGPFGERLRGSMEGKPPHFRMNEAERCPLLNEDNLCDLILTLGENSLCEICTEHPRFHHRLGGRTESGVGLCCEAAAALILGQREPARLQTPTGRAPVFHGLPLKRENLMELLRNRSKPLIQRCREGLHFCGGDAPETDIVLWAERFLTLERMEESWTERLNALAQCGGKIDFGAFAKVQAAYETEYEQLLCYFVYRHFAGISREWGSGTAVSFALLCTGMICALHAMHWMQHGKITFPERVEYARQFSAEIEYSDENPERLLELLAGLE